jgi:hypothetical protein
LVFWPTFVANGLPASSCRYQCLLLLQLLLAHPNQLLVLHHHHVLLLGCHRRHGLLLVMVLQLLVVELVLLRRHERVHRGRAYHHPGWRPGGDWVVLLVGVLVHRSRCSVMKRSGVRCCWIVCH